VKVDDARRDDRRNERPLVGGVRDKPVYDPVIGAVQFHVILCERFSTVFFQQVVNKLDLGLARFIPVEGVVQRPFEIAEVLLPDALFGAFDSVCVVLHTPVFDVLALVNR